VKKLKRDEMMSVTFPMQKSIIVLKYLNVHSFMDGESICKLVKY
jgi:hypothetical protein